MFQCLEKVIRGINFKKKQNDFRQQSRTLKYIYLQLLLQKILMDYYIHKTRAGCVEKHMKREHLRFLEINTRPQGLTGFPSSPGDKRTCPPVQETKEVQAPSLGWEDPLEEDWQPTPVFCLENPMDRGAWWASVQRVPKSRARLQRLSMQAQSHGLQTHFFFGEILDIHG